MASLKYSVLSLSEGKWSIFILSFVFWVLFCLSQNFSPTLSAKTSCATFKCTGVCVCSLESILTDKVSMGSMNISEELIYPTESGKVLGVIYDTRDLKRYPIYCKIEEGERITTKSFPSSALNLEEKSFAAKVALLYSTPTIPTAERVNSFSLASLIFICVCFSFLTLPKVIQKSFILSKKVLPLSTVSKWSSGGASPMTTSWSTILSLQKRRSSFFCAGVSASVITSSIFEGSSSVRFNSFCLGVGTIPRLISCLYANRITCLISLTKPVTSKCEIFFGSIVSNFEKGIYPISGGHRSNALFFSTKTWSSSE